MAGMSDEQLISALTDATRSEAMAAADRLALVAEVTARQCDDEDDVIAHQVVDGWAFAKAQVSAACNLSPHAASTQMRIGVALRDRLPRTAALFGSGAVSARVIGEITWRTHLVTDEDALALIDAAIAAEATEYGALSEAALIRAVDLWVEKFDPIAVIRSKAAAKDLYVEFDDRDDPNGVCSFWGRLRATDKQALQQRLNDLADTVCANDPRTVRERRADALGALGIVGPSLQRLTCRCGDPGCAGSGKDPRSMAVNIYMLADQVPGADARPAPQTGPGPTPTGEPGPEGPEPEPEPAPGPDGPERPAAQTPTPAESDPTPAVDPAAHVPFNSRPVATFAGAGVGVMLDGTVIPAAMLADLIATGAKVRPLREVADLPTERQYRPSTALTAFVRMCSQTCSFPGCSKPAHRCDLDHLIPWPAGATHPGNLRPLCREHHLVKTFRSGPNGWTVKARPDGATEWTSPTGHTYVSTPGAAILFPHWNIHTTVPPPRHISLIHDDHSSAKMPTRQRTRAQDRAHRINAEHTRNATELALASAAKDHNQDRITNGATAPPDIFDSQTTNAADPDPPPF
ncbi:HNH endonuclease signature motif containing protein [Mycolicibacterium diernhoferi]